MTEWRVRYHRNPVDLCGGDWALAKIEGGWVVYCRAPLFRPQPVFEYIGRSARLFAKEFRRWAEKMGFLDFWPELAEEVEKRAADAGEG